MLAKKTNNTTTTKKKKTQTAVHPGWFLHAIFVPLQRRNGMFICLIYYDGWDSSTFHCVIVQQTSPTHTHTPTPPSKYIHNTVPSLSCPFNVDKCTFLTLLNKTHSVMELHSEHRNEAQEMNRHREMKPCVIQTAVPLLTITDFMSSLPIYSTP